MNQPMQLLSEDNPYSLAFGKEPHQLITRSMQQEMIVSRFMNDPVSEQIRILTGVRGSGKTVLMTTISKTLAANQDWIVVELNPERDMLETLASKLASEDHLARLFQKAKINLSFFGIGLEVEATAPVSDIEVALSRMLEALKKHHKKVLITVDEAINSPAMKVFSHSFQIFIRQELPIYLLMTGLFENIRALQNEKSLTFLYRAPRTEMQPLNIGRIASNYEQNFQIDSSTALHMAKLTKGYPFAFQVMGYLSWENQGFDDTLLPVYRQHLEEYVYEKIWSELSASDKKVAYGIACSEHGKIAEIREILHLKDNAINPYRKRLIQKGLIEGDTYGYVHFLLPQFREFVLDTAVE